MCSRVVRRRLPLRRICAACVALSLLSGTSFADDSRDVAVEFAGGDERSATDPVTALVAFLRDGDEPQAGQGESAARGGERHRGRGRGRAEESAEHRGDGRSDRGGDGPKPEQRERSAGPRGPRPGSHPGSWMWQRPGGMPGPGRSLGSDGPRSFGAPGAARSGAAGPGAARPGMPGPGMAPRAQAFSFRIGPDGVVHGGPTGIDQPPGMMARQFQIVPAPHAGGAPPQPGQPAPGQHGVAEGQSHQHVAQQLERILDRLNAIDARLGGHGPQGPGPHGPPPQPAPPGQPPHQTHGQHHGTPHPGPQPPPPHQPGPPVPQPPPHGGPHADHGDLEHRVEVRVQELHRHVEEMGRVLSEKIRGQSGMPEEVRKHHEEIARTHEKLQERFQDVRRRFAEQQERIERLEQEVKRLREAVQRHGESGAAEGTTRKPVSLEDAATL